MTSVEALREACIAARRYRYIPDEVEIDGLIIPVDTWGTLAEFEAKGGGDCDDFSIYAIQTAHGDLYFVAGQVLVRGEWLGHAWVQLIEDGECYWADPTWGEGPQSKEALGYPVKRKPIVQWKHLGNGLFGNQERHV